MRSAKLHLLLPCVAFVAACGPESAGGGPHLGGNPDLASPAKGPVGADLATDDTTCGGQQFQASRVQPNVFLVIDRSGSMGNPISGGSSTKKWDDLKSAVTQLVGGFDSQLHLGMSLYNRDGDCAPGIIDSTLAAMNGADVMSKLSATSPGGNTPTAATLDYVRQHAGLNDPSRPNIVLLATDGLPNCGDTDVTGKIDALYNSTPSIKTFVIGVGSDTSSNPGLLNAWADAGHTARTGPTHYFQSNSSTELADAFQTIANGIVSCTVALSAVPPDPSQLYVWMGGVQVPLDAVNGYSYFDGPPSVTLNGAQCDQLKADPTKKVQIVYGCPSAPPIL